MSQGEPNKISFHYLVKPFFFPKRKKLKAFLTRQLANYEKPLEVLSYIFCDDAYLLQINQRYLKHDTYTDIVTFELSEAGKPLVADVYISVERVRENAKTFKVSFQDEVLRVIFHGALHLAGLKDKTALEKKAMREAESAWLSSFTISRETVST